MFQIPVQNNTIPTNEAKTMYERVIGNINHTNIEGLEEIMKFNEQLQNNDGTSINKTVVMHDVEKVQRNMTSALIKEQPMELSGHSNEALEVIDREGYYKNRYASVEGGTDTIGIGHKMSEEEHKGGYVLIGGQKIDVTNGLKEEQILQLWEQDDMEHTERLKNDLKDRGLNMDSLTPEMTKVLKRLTYNMGSVPNSLTDSLSKGDMDGFNTGLLRMVGMKGNTVLSAGLSRDRAKSYNLVNKDKIAEVEFLKRKGGGSIYIYYDAEGKEVKKYETDKPLDKSNSYNKRYGL